MAYQELHFAAATRTFWAATIWPIRSYILQTPLGLFGPPLGLFWAAVFWTLWANHSTDFDDSNTQYIGIFLAIKCYNFLGLQFFGRSGLTVRPILTIQKSSTSEFFWLLSVTFCRCHSEF